MFILYAKSKNKLNKVANEINHDLSLLDKIKKELKDSDIVKDLFKEYNQPESLIDAIPIDVVDDIDVSAKTLNGRIKINKSLESEGFDIVMRYVVHELVHVLQHMTSDEPGDPYEDYDYMDRPDEVEAFQKQIEFDKENRGEDAVIEYVEELVDYHDLDGADAEDKKKELLGEE